jgi:hypothetical protein
MYWRRNSVEKNLEDHMKGRPANFARLWVKYQKERVHAVTLDPPADRCALVLSLTLDVRPHQDTKSASFEQLSLDETKPKRRQGGGNYYVRASELAGRLANEWGKPDVVGRGTWVFNHIEGRTGVLFIHKSLRYAEIRHLHPKLGDHIDLWDGSMMGSVPDRLKGDLVVTCAFKASFWELI